MTIYLFNRLLLRSICSNNWNYNPVRFSLIVTYRIRLNVGFVITWAKRCLIHICRLSSMVTLTFRFIDMICLYLNSRLACLSSLRSLDQLSYLWLNRLCPITDCVSICTAGGSCIVGDPNPVNTRMFYHCDVCEIFSIFVFTSICHLKQVIDLRNINIVNYHCALY